MLLPAGPKSIEEVFEWASFNQSQLQVNPLWARNLRDKFDGGIHLRTHCSGIDFPTLALYAAHRAQDRRDSFEECVMTSHAAEQDPGARGILLQFAYGQADHVFGNMLDRLPDEERAEFLKLQPKSTASTPGRIDANNKMLQYLANNSHRCFKMMLGESHCYKCGKACRVYQRFIDKAAYRRGARKFYAVRRPPGESYCHELWIFGQPCQDESVRGKRMRTGGDKLLVFHIWVVEVRKYKPHSWLHEITGTYNAVMLHDCLSDLYDISSVLLSPVELGLPSSRTRHYSWGNLREHFVTLARLPSLKEKFGRSCDLAGDVYLGGAPLDAAHEQHNSIATRRHFAFKPEDFRSPIAPECVLSPSTVTRMKEYCKLFDKVKSLDGVACCDLEHNVDHAHFSRVMPCLLTHGQVGVFNQTHSASGIQTSMPRIRAPNGLEFRLLHPHDLFLVMGSPVHGVARWSAPYAHIIGKLPYPVCKAVTGNGMHVGAVGAIIQFGLAMVAW